MESAMRWLLAVIGFFAIPVLAAASYLAIPLAPPRPVPSLGVMGEPEPAAGCDVEQSLLMPIEQESMRTTLEPGEVVALTDHEMAGGDIVRGDIVGFVLGDPSTTPPYTSRVIGEPG